MAPTESGELAKDLIADAVARHQVPPDQLTIHADRGSSMTSNQVAELLSFLGIKRTHSRPHVSNDNPYSEAQFKTLKYCPAFPERFGCIADARVVLRVVLLVLQPRPPSLGDRLSHAGLGALRHRGRGAVPAQETLDAAYATNPTRFRHRSPNHPSSPPSPGSTSR